MSIQKLMDKAKRRGYWLRKHNSPNVDGFFPPCGPCACCGEGDARHRIFDAIRDRWEAGDSAKDLAADYRVSMAAIRAVVAG